MRRAFVVLPIIFFIFLGSLIFSLGLKFESYRMHDNDLHWLTLHMISFKEMIKDSLYGNKISFVDNKAEISLEFDRYAYKAIITKFDMQLSNQYIYYVDLLGRHVALSQEFSRREDFIFSPQFVK